MNGAVVFTGQPGTQAPPGSESIGITLSSVTIENASPALATANEAFRTRLTQGRVPVSELFDATAALEEAYANAGFVLTRVVLPQQSLRDGGVLRVTVVSGFVETVDTAAVPAPVRQRLDSLTVPLLDRTGITLRELERQLLLAGDASGVALNTALAAGTRPGGTVLALDAAFRRVTGFIGADNFASSDLGRPVINAGVEVNSALSLGETLYGRLSAAPEGVLSGEPRYRVLALGALVPVGASGLTLNAEVTSSRTHPESNVAPTRSAFDRQSLRLIYPVIRSRELNLSTQIGIDHQTDSQDLLVPGGAAAIYEDEITVLRAGLSGSKQTGEGQLLEGGITLSRGLDIFGARRAGAVPLSRQGAAPEFTKLNLSARYQRAVGETLTFSLSGRAQSAFGDAVVTAEQFGIVGAGDLSSFDSGGLRGDSGYVLRTEVARPINTTLLGRSSVFSPYVFAGFGAVSLARPTALEQDRVTANAYGLGFDVLLQGETPFRADTIRVEFGKGNRDDGKDDTRFSISGNFRF
ncbi:ShlB/FhaC/HecB family hemolysin secretion/activation protein [Loktanella sp. M215]|nr:ShlB/FhaC/HecB family hemolysin secretion/activation protein [Loktanella sp. M215]